MICRIWRAETTADQANAYQSVALTKLIPSIEAMNIPGFLHIDVLRYPLPNKNVQFATLMWFETADAIKAFAGEDSEASYLPPEITAVLAHYDRRATHFEVVARRPQHAPAGLGLPTQAAPRLVRTTRQENGMSA